MNLAFLATRYSPQVVACITCGLHVFMLARQFSFSKAASVVNTVLPLDWLLLREIIGVIFTVFGPWGGWVFVVPYSIALLQRWPSAHLATLLFICGGVVGTANALISFEVFQLVRVATSTATYLFVFSISAAVVSPIVLLIRRSLPCQE